MSATQIAQNLAYINWTVLAGLALGAYAAVVLLRRRTAATRGYLGFVAACAIGFGILAWLSDRALPGSLGTSPVVPDPTYDLPRRVSLALFSGAALLALVARRRSSAWADGLEVVALAAGASTVVFGALGWGGTPAGAAALLVQLAVLFAATGGVFAAMILGHWYLVTPRLPEAPLILLSRILLGVMAIQVALFVAWVGLGAGPASGGPFSALDGAVGPVRLVAADRRAHLPADRVVGCGPDGADPVDGIGDRPPVHQRRHDRRRHHPRRRPVLRRRPAGLTKESIA